MLPSKMQKKSLNFTLVDKLIHIKPLQTHFIKNLIGNTLCESNSSLILVIDTSSCFSCPYTYRHYTENIYTHLTSQKDISGCLFLNFTKLNLFNILMVQKFCNFVHIRTILIGQFFSLKNYTNGRYM